MNPRRSMCRCLVEYQLRKGKAKNDEGRTFPMTRELAMQMTGRKTRSVFERYNIVSVGDLCEVARRLDIATGTISGTIEENRRSGSKV